VSTPYYELRETLLKVEGVSRSYGENVIVRNLDLEVKNIHRPGLAQGQVVGLLGPSGMGKTTLFRVLAGLDQPDTGSVMITVDGKSVPVQRGMVGVVAQHYPLFAHRTVLGNLVVAGRQTGLGTAEATEKARGLLEQFILSGSEDKYPAQLSGGMRQRVAIAQQFMCSEGYILMDEPFSGLDPVAVDRVVKFIQECAATDELKTFIIVTHDIEAAVEVSDTIWLMGRERDADNKVIPGAFVQATYDLIERGLTWQPNVVDMPEFYQTCREIRSVFPRL
jgi:NitT/TauT family transport system ATP-binding protein